MGETFHTKKIILHFVNIVFMTGVIFYSVGQYLLVNFNSLSMDEIMIVIILGLKKSIRNRHITNSIAILLSLVVLIFSIVDVSSDLDLKEYISNQFAFLLLENYVSSNDTTITFSYNKRNLILFIWNRWNHRLSPKMRVDVCR